MSKQEENQSEAFELAAAYDRYSDDIFRFCLMRTRNRELALDVTQDTFIKAWNYLKDGRDVEHLKALLYTIARNLIIDHSRKKKPDASLDQLMDNGFMPSDGNHESKMQQRMDAHTSLKALQHLKAEYREVIELRYLQELSVKEIAALLNVRANLISVRLNRAMDQLRKYIPDDK